MLSESLEGQQSTAPCNHLVVYETDLGGRSVFLRTKESFAACFPLELFVIEDLLSSSELSSVRSERSVNSRSSGADMANRKSSDGSGYSDRKARDRGD